MAAGVPLRYFPLLYAGFASTALVIVFLIAMRVHFHVTVGTHCSPRLSLQQEASFRNWRWDPEFLPSISSASGDHLPERPIWRLALAFGLPFLLVSHYYAYRLYRRGDAATSRTGLSLSHVFIICLILKIAFGFGYNFIASSEHWTVHTYSFGAYLFIGFLIQVVHVALTYRYQSFIPAGNGTASLRSKLFCLTGQTLCILGVIKFFLFDHVGHCIPGAYSRSNMCEWIFALFNLAFDATVYYDMGDNRISVDGTSAAQKEADPFVGTWRSIPSKGLLWAAEISTSYFLFTTVIQMLKQMYFIPMVAMRFTPEALMACTVPFGIVAALRVPFVRRVLTPAPDRTMADAVTLQKWLSIFTMIAAASLFQTDLMVKPELKILVSGIAPHILFAVYRLRAMCLSAKAASLSAAMQHAKPSDEVSFVETLAATVTQEQHRIVFGLPFGVVLNMLVRYWGLSLDLFVVDPLFNVYFLIAFLVIQAIGPLRLYLVELLHLRQQNLPLAAPSTVTQGWAAAAAFGLLFGLTELIASSTETTSRYVGIDPLSSWWAPPSTVIAVLCGIMISERLALGGPTAQKRTVFMVIASAMGGGTLVLYYGTTQSNRYYQPNADVLEKWAMESRSGSPMFAFIGGLVVQGCIGTLWPTVAAWFYGFPLTIVADTVQSCVSGGATENHTQGTAVQRTSSIELIGYLCFALVVVANIYCAVFPFVPLGPLLRDRMDLVLFGTVGGILLSVERLLHTSDASVRCSLRDRSFKVTSLCALFALLTGILVANRAFWWTDAPNPVLSQGRHSQADVNGAIWTIHFADDDYGVDSLPRIVQYLKQHRANVIGFLESDGHRIVSANRDFALYVAYQLGYRYSDYGPTALDGTFGCALISQFPIVDVDRMVLPSPMGELACMIRARIRVLPDPAPLVTVFVGHWGNTHHVQDVVLQSEVLRDMALKTDGPTVFLGYLVTHAGHRNYYRFVQSDGADEDRLLSSQPEGDDTAVWPAERLGHPLPRIPIVKQYTRLFRDAARDLLRGRNPFFVGPLDDHRQALAVQDKALITPWLQSLYWRVHAIPKGFTDPSIAFEGRVATKALRDVYLVSQLEDAALHNIRSARGRLTTQTVFPNETTPLSSLHCVNPSSHEEALTKLQSAAEYKGRRLVLSNGLELRREDKDVSVFKQELTRLENFVLVYEFPNTGRVQIRHPRREYNDRYCQYILYRDIPLLDWYRVLDIDEISDTELMIGKFRLQFSH